MDILCPLCCAVADRRAAKHFFAVIVLPGMTTESPKLVARLAGMFFLLTILGGIIA